MEDGGTAPMAAAVSQPRPPPPRTAGSRRGFFAFLKDGVLVTTRNRGIFLSLAAVHAARSLALLAARIVSLRYTGPTLGLSANDGEDGFLLDKLLDDGHWWLLLAGAACLVVKEALVDLVGHAIQVATTACAAASIEAEEGGRTTLTLASMLGEVRRRDLHEPMATALFVKVVGWATAVAWVLVTLAVLAGLDASVGRTPAVLIFLLLHLVATPVVFIYCKVACEVAVVVSVAEPGQHTGGALRRARRLTWRGGKKKVAQATLHAMLSWALNKAVWRMYDVAVARVPLISAPIRLDAVIVYILVGAVEVLYTATVTAYYFDCKRAEKKAEGHVHIE